MVCLGGHETLVGVVCPAGGEWKLSTTLKVENLPLGMDAHYLDKIGPTALFR